MVLAKRMAGAVEGRYFKKRNLGLMRFSEFGERYLKEVIPMMKSARTERTRVLKVDATFRQSPLGSDYTC